MNSIHRLLIPATSLAKHIIDVAQPAAIAPPSSCRLALPCLLLLIFRLDAALPANAAVVAWSANWHGQTNAPSSLSNVVAVAAGETHSLALRADGTVVAWGNNSSGQTNVPADLTNVVAVAAGETHSLALRANGTVLAWGDNEQGQTDVPPDLSNVVAIAAGRYHSLALRADGTVLAWGYNAYGQTNAPSGISDVVAVAAGGYHSLALRADGTVVAWGDNGDGQWDVPPDLSNVVAIAAGGHHSLALRADGTVVAWGYNGDGQLDVPPSLSDVIAVAAGRYHSLALRADGTVVAWGDNKWGQQDVPPDLSCVAAIAAGGSHSLALVGLPDGIAAPQLVGSRFLIGTADRPFHHRIGALNGVTSYGASGLPQGLVVDPNTGLITGEPAQAGEFSVTLSATNALGVDQWTVTLVVNLPLPGVFISGIVHAVLGHDFRYPVIVVNDPDWISVSGLPDGLAFDAATGIIAGVPLQISDYPVTLLASNRYGVTSGTMTIRVSSVAAWGNSYEGQTDVPPNLSNVIAVAAGDIHSLALRANGTVMAWGANYYGQYYDQANVPPNLSNVVAVAAGGYHSLALRADGTVVAWGYNGDGQLDVPPDLTKVVAVSAGWGHSLALRADGIVVTWGNNYDDEADVPSGLSNVVALAAGGIHNLALRANGTVVAWGDNEWGQTDVPPDLSNVVAVAAGGSHSLALRANGTVLAWGDNAYGQTDVPPDLSNVVAVAAGGSHSLALRADGTVVAWGDNKWGQQDVPPDLSCVAAIAAGGSHSLALVGLPDGIAAPQLVGSRFLIGTVDRPFHHRIAALNGATSYGASGLPQGLVVDPNTGLITGEPAQAGEFSVTLSATNALGVDQWTVTLVVNLPLPGVFVSGIVHAVLGHDFRYPVIVVNDPDWVNALDLPDGLSYDAATGVIAGTPVQVGDYPVTLLASNQYGVTTGSMMIWISPVAAWGDNEWSHTDVPRDLSNVAAGGLHSLALRTNGTVVAWGDNEYGQTDVPPDLSNVVAVAAGDIHSLALRANGTVIAWGNNDWNQTDVPPDLSNVVAVAAGWYHSLALRTDGTVAAWGNNDWNQTDVPPDLSDVVAVAAGGLHSLALRTNGTVVAWGDNEYGQLDVPPDLSSAVAVAAGGLHSLALRADGTVVAWGDNGYSQTDVPPDLSNVVAVAAGDIHSLALRANGTVIAWGDNQFGQTDVPPDLSNVVAVAAGGYHSLALRADDTVVAWGANWDGQTDVPPDLSDVAALAAGVLHSLALRTNGTVVAWGDNSYGQTDVPPHLSNVVAVAAGGWHSLTLRGDGTVIAWGDNEQGQTDVPPDLSNAVAVAAGGYHSLALVTVQPAILKQPGSRSDPVGATATLTVAATGLAPLACQWRKDGINLKDGGSISGATTMNLMITNIQPGDAGHYTVVVSNAYGCITSAVAVLTVAVPLHWATGGDAPWFAQTGITHDGVEAMQSGLINDDQESWLETTVTGPGTLSFWWKISSEEDCDYLCFYINGVAINEISGEVDWEEQNYTLAAGMQTLRWRYFKDGSVSSGQDSAWLDEVNLLPTGPPTIVAQPSDQTSPLGGAATFTVSAVGAFPLRYQWFFNGAGIVGATKESYTINNVQSRDEGTYSVVVSNDFGITNSSVATLTLITCFGDNFSGVFCDPTKWGPDYHFGAGGQLAQTNGVLQFQGDATVVRPWLGSYGSYTQNWEIVADVNLGDVVLSQNESHVQVFLLVANHNDTVIRDGWPGENLSVALDLYYEAPDPMERSFESYFRTNWVEVKNLRAHVNTTSRNASLRISFAAATKTLTSWYDPDGAANGYSWTVLQSVQITAPGTTWHMDDNSSFRFGLGVGCEGYTVGAGDEVGADNFAVCGGVQLGAPLFTNPGQFVWARSVARSSLLNDELVLGVAVDAANNIYVAGWFEGENDFGGTMLTSYGGQDAFLAKYNSAGMLQWVRQAGGSYAEPVDDDYWDHARGVGVDAAGNVYVTGGFRGQATFDGTIMTSQKTQDFFLAKYSPAGNLLWVRQGYDSDDYAYGTGMAVDAAGTSLVVGYFDSQTVTFDGVTASNPSTSHTAFIAKYDSAGTIQWAQGLGGGRAYSTTVGMDAAGNCYVAGGFEGTLMLGNQTLTSVGGENGFLAKLNSAGVFQWVRQIKGPTMDGGRIGVDPSGNCVCIIGALGGVFDIGGLAVTNTNASAMFVAKYDTAGVLQWVQAVQGTGAFVGNEGGCAIDQAGNCYIPGAFTGSACFGGTVITNRGGWDTFVAKYDAAGNFQWVQTAGGSLNDGAFRLAVDSGGAAYVAGWFQWIPAFGRNFLQAQSYRDIFLAKLATPLQFCCSSAANGWFRTRLRGPTGAQVIVETSIDLTDWTPWRTNTLPAGWLPLERPMGTNDGNLFFRARIP